MEKVRCWPSDCQNKPLVKYLDEEIKKLTEENDKLQQKIQQINNDIYIVYDNDWENQSILFVSSSIEKILEYLKTCSHIARYHIIQLWNESALKQEWCGEDFMEHYLIRK